MLLRDRAVTHSARSVVAAPIPRIRRCRGYHYPVNGTRPSPILQRFRWYRRSRLWVVPSAGAAIAVVLGAASLTIDHAVITDAAPFPIFSGSPSTARSMLALIATSMATLTALVLTVVAVVLQLATQALSPRAVRTFLQDAQSHLTLGVFVTTFTYALVILQELNLTYDTQDELIKSSSVAIAFVLAVVSLGMFISYVDHIVHLARVTSIIDRIANETRDAIAREYAGEDAGAQPVEGRIPDRPPDVVIRSPRHGVILEIDIPALVNEAAQQDVVIAMIPARGDFIPIDGRLFEVYGVDGADEQRLMRSVEIDAERSITQDVPFGFRLLVDIAERALSTGVNDPTTATQVIDQLHDLLQRLGSRPFPSGWHADDAGEPRLLVPLPTWDTYVALAFEEIRHYGRGSLAVVRRLRSAAEALIAELPDHRRPPLARQLAILDKAAEKHFDVEAERRAARHVDVQGIGSGDGFVATDTPPPSQPAAGT